MNFKQISFPVHIKPNYSNFKVDIRKTLLKVSYHCSFDKRSRKVSQM